MREFPGAVAVLALLAASTADARPRAGKPTKPAVAQAGDPEPVRTNQAVVVRKKPGAKAAVVGRLPAKTAVVVLREEGAWLRIRAKPEGKRKHELVGYIARSTVTTPMPAAATAGVDDTPDVDTPLPKQSRQTAERVTIRDKPGEKQTALATLPAGATVIVEAERGRWLKVRSGKIVGYVARTTLAAPPPATPIPTASATQDAVAAAPEIPQSKWSTARRTDPAQVPTMALFAEVTASTALRADPKADAPVVSEVQRGARVVVLDTAAAAGWVRVRDDHGAEGWVPRDRVGNGSAAVAVTGSTDDVAVVTSIDSSPAAPARRGSTLRLDAGVGYRVIGMDFTSNGTSGLANYLVTADASAADLAADLVVVRTHKLSVAIDAQLEVSRSSPGIDYVGPSHPSGKIPFSTIDVDAGARAGYRVRRLFELGLRGGIHYDAFVAKDVENAGMLPRERLLGATLGARAEVVPPHSRFGATLRADALVAGSRRQTPGLEDGASSTVGAVWGGMTVRVQLARHFSLLSAYDFGRTTTTWSGSSVRMPGVTNARRTDSSQLVQIGLSVEM